MSFISKKLKQARRIGRKIGHGAVRLARKGGKVVSRLSNIATKVGGIVSMIPGGQEVGGALIAGGAVGSAVGDLSQKVGRSGQQFMDDGNAKGLLERTKKHVQEGRDIQRQFRD